MACPILLSAAIITYVYIYNRFCNIISITISPSYHFKIKQKKVNTLNIKGSTSAPKSEETRNEIFDTSED